MTITIHGFLFLRANLPLPGVCSSSTVYSFLCSEPRPEMLRVYRALMARGPPGALLVGLEGRPLGHRALQWAAQAASAGRRCIMARCAPAAHHGALWRARAFASSRRKVSVVGLTRPPTSTPQTTSRQRRACLSSGQVRRLRVVCGSTACARARPGCWSARGRGWPSRRTGLTGVASTATWAPCHRGRPLATTSLRRPSLAGTSRLRSRRATCVATRAPASLQMRAAARSRASSPACLRSGSRAILAVSDSRQKPSLPVTRVAEAGRPGLLPTVRVARRTKLQTFPFRRIAMLCRQLVWLV